MNKNIGTIDALMRITIGLTGVAWGTSRMLRRPNSSTPLLLTMASAMKVAEGVTRFCPLTALFRSDYDSIIAQAKEKLPLGQNRVEQTMDKALDDAERFVENNEEFEPHH
jgi:hypothetical protein